MSLLRQLARGLRALTHRSQADRDVGDEVQDYLEQATAAHLARGLSPRDALRAARLELGGVTQVVEQVRASGWEYGVDTVLSDLRYGARRLRVSPGFTAVTVLTLALGIGAATAIFSAVDPILFEPLPYPHPDRIVSVLELYASGSRGEGTFAMYRQFLERSRSLAAVAVCRPWLPTVTGADQPERLLGQRVSAGYFRVLGVSPVVGRDFEASDDRLHGPNVVILSDGLWRRRFAGDRTIVGREITLDDSLFTVIGVMPGGFGSVLAPSATLWAPLQYDPSLPAQGREWGHHLHTVARLRPGIRPEAAALEINGLGRDLLAARHPETYDPNTRFTVAPLQAELTRAVRPALLVISGAVALVLVIACVNATNLLLARAVRRRREFALRSALGAGRGRLVRQLLTESLLLAVIGGGFGMVVAMVGLRALVALSPPALPRVGAIGTSGTLFSFGLGITTVIGLAFGLVPALQAARHNPQVALRHGPHQTGPGHRRVRGALVVTEVALALVLLVSSGLLLRSMARLFAVPVGFDPSGVLTMQVQIVGHRFDDDGATHRFFDRMLEAVRRVPGVTSAGLTSQLPLSGDRDEYGALFEATPTQAADTYNVFRYASSPGYLETMHLPLHRGRLLDDRDGGGAPLVALISQSLADARFGGSDPIGRLLRIGPAGPYTIVGVVGDVKQMSLAVSDSNAVYTPAAQWPFADRAMSLVVRGRGDLVSLAPTIRQAVWSVDKDEPVMRVATMTDLLAASAAERRFALTLFVVFALVALVLAAAGIYGVLSGVVAERTREIGVRAALGASRRNILALVLGQGLILSGLGVAVGLAAAAGTSQVIVAMLFGVSRLDPVTYLGVIALVMGVSAIASAVPAWRAARLDPTKTLRAE